MSVTFNTYTLRFTISNLNHPSKNMFKPCLYKIRSTFTNFSVNVVVELWDSNIVTWHESTGRTEILLYRVLSAFSLLSVYGYKVVLVHPTLVTLCFPANTSTTWIGGGRENSHIKRMREVLVAPRVFSLKRFTTRASSVSF